MFQKNATDIGSFDACNVSERALDFNIILDDVAITELAFSPQYSAAVEAKQVAAQEAQRASFLVERAKQQRQEKIVQAEGEAQSAKLVIFFLNPS